MKTKILLRLSVLFALLIVMASCSKDDPIEPEQLPINLPADNNWIDTSLTVNQTLWFKVTDAETFTTLYVEWAEADFHGSTKSYSGDAKVSAYAMDGITPYFQEVSNGYKDDKQEIALSSEKEILIKVELADVTRPGTFAIRVTGTATLDLVYKKLTLDDTWDVDTIAAGETIGYSVDCGDTPLVQIIWAEVDSPEGPTEGYTAEIIGSVFYKDGITPYKQYGKADDFLNKNNSHSDNPKAVEVDQTEKKIKIHIAVGTKHGTYAIKVIPLVE
ncbi:MAG: hypothetical protein AB7S69_09390 [Salinivirgaceae bacterium]